jgi:hypothetical protein
MHNRLLELYCQRDEIETIVSNPNFSASGLDRAELILEGLEEEMRHLISDSMLHLRNQA